MTRTHRYPVTLGLAVAAMVLVGAACGSDAPDPSAQGGTSSSAQGGTSSSASTTTTAPFTQMVDVGDGNELYVECRGEGSPTILLEAGDESGREEWSEVVADLAAETRTCAYDRRGNGRSSDAEGCRGMDDLIADVEAVIAGASMEAPFIFVGASGGGYLAAEMATRHPDDTAGLVLVETPKAITIIPPDLAPILKCDAPTNIERRDYVAVEHAVWDDRKEIGDFPMVIFSNEPDQFAEGDELTNVEDQKGWLVLSPKAEQVVVDSGHEVADNEPDLVVDEILDVLEAARAG